MKDRMKKAGIAVLILGVAVLVAGIIMSLTVGTYLVPVFISASIVINTIGVMLLQKK
jgi:hypothetical protein